eukprot:gene3761-biopygen6777
MHVTIAWMHVTIAWMHVTIAWMHVTIAWMHVTSALMHVTPMLGCMSPVLGCMSPVLGCMPPLIKCTCMFPLVQKQRLPRVFRSMVPNGRSVLLPSLCHPPPLAQCSVVPPPCKLPGEWICIELW